MNTASAERAREPDGPLRWRVVASPFSSVRAVFGVALLLFAVGLAHTVRMSVSMSMPWMRMPGQSWPGVATVFLGMWLAMMIAMMLPSLLPMLWRYRRAVGGRGETHLDWLAGLVGAGYFTVWSGFGMAAFALGLAVAAVQVRLPAVARALPYALAALPLIAGALQFTGWKARRLACCRGRPGRDSILPADAGTAWRYGLRCGLDCSYCCLGLTAVLLTLGPMDLRAMAMVTLAISAERLVPAGERMARGIGAILMAIGLVLLARACEL
jgi:predicted metal-binding membrane protein